jgi:hypothetical protein
MTRPPQPEPYPGDIPPRAQARPGWAVLRREYLDALGRPMTGDVSIISRTRAVVGDTIIPASSVRRPVVAGVLEVELPPNTYELKAQLRTADGDTFTDNTAVRLEPTPPA